MPFPLANADQEILTGWRWVLLLVQSGMFIFAVAIILRLAQEKRTPSNIFAWSLLLIFLPIVGVPLYLVFGGRKVRRLVARKSEIQRLANMAARESGVAEAALVQGSGAFEGNSVEFLGDGVAAYRALCEEIEKAQESIHITTFIVGRDNVSRDIVQRLARRARAGVKVRLLMDALGSLGQGGRFCDPIRRAGGEVARFIPLVPIGTKASANLRNHRKIALFDNARAIVGGQNIDGRFIAPYDTPRLFTDFSVRIGGPVVAALTRAFVGDWVFASGQAVDAFRPLFSQVPKHCGESRIEVIVSGPDVEGDPLWERIITLVQEARSEVTLVTPYFIPDEVLLRSMIIKAHRGKRVRIIVPGKSNHPIVDLARNHFLRQLHNQGVEVLFYQQRMLHAKLLIVDKRVALTGSANIDPRSLFVNFEIGLIHDTPADLRHFNLWLRERVLPHCVRYTEHRRSSTSRRRLLAEDLAHLLTPLL